MTDETDSMRAEALEAAGGDGELAAHPSDLAVSTQEIRFPFVGGIADAARLGPELISSPAPQMAPAALTANRGLTTRLSSTTDVQQFSVGFVSTINQSIKLLLWSKSARYNEHKVPQHIS